MATLHLVRQSAFATNDLLQCIEVVAENDEVVLIDDGCYSLNHPALVKLFDNEINITVKVVEKHALARGIKIPKQITAIKVKTLVELTFYLETVITWQ